MLIESLQRLKCALLEPKVWRQNAWDFAWAGIMKRTRTRKSTIRRSTLRYLRTSSEYIKWFGADYSSGAQGGSVRRFSLVKKRRSGTVYCEYRLRHRPAPSTQSSQIIVCFLGAGEYTYVKLTSSGAQPVNICLGRSVLPGYIALSGAQDRVHGPNQNILNFKTNQNNKTWSFISANNHASYVILLTSEKHGCNPKEFS